MTYLSIDEAEAFFLATLREHELGHIGDHDVFDRMRSLAELVDPETAERLRDEYSLPTKDVPDDADPRGDDEQSEIRSPTDVSANGAEGWGGSPSPVLELVVQNVKGMSKWHFRQGDPDHFPSVPHGHENNMDWPVCDPYTGRVFDGERDEIKSERLSRKTRILIWKDPKFRAFALSAIMYHEVAFPYRPLRVRYPHRLPRIFRH